jgi:CheY-like chemotaxis protein
VAAEPSARAVLLIEDNPADADLVTEMLDVVEGDRYRFDVVHATRMSDAVDRLGKANFDVVLLDLGLPDAFGPEALTAIQLFAGRTPIVVLTGRDDDALALQCIKHGAQDYLSKSEIRPVPLRRSINYAINRSHELEIRDLRENLERYREMASTASIKDDAAASGGNGALRARQPGAFDTWVGAYSGLLRCHFDRLVVQTDKPRDEMARIAAELGQHGAGPRDLVDIHVTALSQVLEKGNSVKARTLALEGRLLALEMMGLLVDYYRVRRGAGIR